MFQQSLLSFQNRVERILAQEVHNNYPFDWNEDFITRSLLKRLRNEFEEFELFGFKEKIKIKLACYKLSAKNNYEYHLGDIGIFVDSKYRDGMHLKGLAFIEAKKRIENTIRFDEMRVDQLKRIERNIPSSKLLLYDYEEIVNYPLNRHPEPRDSEEYYRFLESPLSTYAVTLPINTAIASGRKDTTLYKLSNPFSYQLCNRYFLGLDLDYRSGLIDVIEGIKSNLNLPLPKYLLAARIGHDGIEPNQDGLINQDFYTILE